MKFSTLLALILSLLFVTIQVYAQDNSDFDGGVGGAYNPDNDYEFGEPGYEPLECPDNGFSYYKDCTGDLDACSRYLGEAERVCEKATGISCSGFTNRINSRCDDIKSLCFGNQECNSTGDNCYKCDNINVSMLVNLDLFMS